MSAQSHDLDAFLVRALQRQTGDLLAAENQNRRKTGQTVLSGEAERQAGRGFISSVISQYRYQLTEAGKPPLDYELENALTEAIFSRIFGAGSLQHLLDNEDIENIDINGHQNVFVTYADGRTEKVDPVADTEDELVDQIQVLAAHAGVSSRAFDAANPQLDLRLPDGSRLSAVQQATPWPVYSIRRNRLGSADLRELIDSGTMSTEVADLLAAAVKARLNIMIAGATNAGKTTLLRALAKEIGPEERLITIEKAYELGLHLDVEAHPDAVPFEEVLPNSEGFGAITMDQLVRRSLRMNPSRVIVGEVLGDEVVSMLNAMSQGNDGSLSTIHSISARDSLTRLGVYAKQAPEKLDLETTAALTAISLDLVVFIKKDGAVRSVREIIEVSGFTGSHATSSALYLDDGSGTAVRNSDAGISDKNFDALSQVGWKPAEDRGW